MIKLAVRWRTPLHGGGRGAPPPPRLVDGAERESSLAAGAREVAMVALGAVGLGLEPHSRNPSRAANACSSSALSASDGVRPSRRPARKGDDAYADASLAILKSTRAV